MERTLLFPFWKLNHLFFFTSKANFFFPLSASLSLSLSTLITHCSPHPSNTRWTPATSNLELVTFSSKRPAKLQSQTDLSSTVLDQCPTGRNKTLPGDDMMLIVARMLQHGLITNTPSNAHVRKRRPRGFIRVVREDRPISALSTLQSSLHRSLLISIVGSTGSLGMHQHGVMKMCFELVLVSEQEVASEGFLCETHLQLFLHIFVFFPGTKNPLTVSLIFLVTIFFILSLSLLGFSSKDK